MRCLSPIRNYPVDPLFPAGPTAIHDQFLDEATYLEVVSKTAIACTDVVCLAKDESGKIQRKLYLAKRNAFPQKDVWVIGGRLFFNDPTVETSIRRIAKRETAVEFEIERFIPLCTNFYTFSRVAQGDFPGKSLCCIFAIVLAINEVQQISAALIKSEYEHGFGLQGFSRSRLVRENCHPMLTDLYDQVFPTQKVRAEMLRLARRPIWNR